MSAPSRKALSVYFVIRPRLYNKTCIRYFSSGDYPKYDYPAKGEEDELYMRLRRTVAPWQIIPYELQLQKIHNRAAFALTKVRNTLLNFKGDKSMYKSHFKNFEGELPCELLSVRPSPVQDNYRNKESPVIDKGVDGSPDIGFYIPPGKFPNLDICGLPLKTQKLQHIAIVQAFKKFVAKSSFPAVGYRYEPLGGWKSILVRTNKNGEAMVGTCVSPFDAPRDQLDRIQDSVYEFIVNGDGKHYGITSLYHQEMSWINHNPTPEKSYKHLHGDTYITETLLGKQFQIQPLSFFQCNLHGAEVLYQTIEELCQLKENTVLLDVCCGTGTIGIIIAHKVKKVYGIERVQDAIDDAKENCIKNGISNTEYFTGLAEKLLPHILNDHVQEGDDIVAVLNPGRGGVGKKVTRALRRCENIKRVVFASCKPLGRMQFNMVELCRPIDEQFLGKPFLPTKAIPVDMFPHTRHYELVVLFER